MMLYISKNIFQNLFDILTASWFLFHYDSTKNGFLLELSDFIWHQICFKTILHWPRFYQNCIANNRQCNAKYFRRKLLVLAKTLITSTIKAKTSVSTEYFHEISFLGKMRKLTGGLSVRDVTVKWWK